MDFASHLKCYAAFWHRTYAAGSVSEDTKQVLTGKTSVSIAGRRVFKVL